MKICGPDGLHDLRLSSMTEQWTESGSKYLRSVRLSSSRVMVRDRQTNRMDQVAISAEQCTLSSSDYDTLPAYSTARLLPVCRRT